MQTIAKLLENRGSYPQQQEGKKPPAHYFQQVALDYIAKLNTPDKSRGRIFGAVKRNPQAAAVAFNETIRSDATDKTLYFLDLFNRAAGSSKKKCKCGADKPADQETCYQCYKKTWAPKPPPKKPVTITENVCEACE